MPVKPIIIEEKDLGKVRKEIDKAYNEKKFVIIRGNKIEFNRKILEDKKTNALIIVHINQEDKLKQRDSGLNQVLCKIAKDKDKLILFDLRELIDTHGKEKAKILGRWAQNVMLLKKYNVKTGIINEVGRDKQDIFSLFLTLGSDTKFAKEIIAKKVF